MNKRYSLLILFFVILYLTGCGYTTGALLPSHLKTVYVENFQNKIDISKEPSDKHQYRIYRAGTENDITQEIIDKFIFDGNLRIVEEGEANLLLTGELVDYYKQPLRYDRLDNVEEYRIIVSVNMELKDVVKNEIMWKERGFIGYDTYRLTGSFASSEDEAREGAIEDLASKVVEKVIEGW